MQIPIFNKFKSVEDYLKNFLQLSKKNIHMIRMDTHKDKNILLINSKSADINSPLNENDILTINRDFGTSSYLKNHSREITIEFEDEFLLIASKPTGIKTHPNDNLAEDDTLLNYLFSNYDYLEPIHRLDTDTTGLVIFAKTPLVKAKLDSMLEKKEIKRYYTALTKRPITPKTITTNIGRDKKEKNKMAVVQNGKEAITNILSCEKLGEDTYKLEISLSTGRTHQIRVHLSYEKAPIIGDRLYSRDGYKFDKMYLGALKLEFTHPITNKKISLTSSLKKDFENILLD